MPITAYCYPEVAGVGLDEETAKHKKVDYVTGKFEFKNNERAVLSG